MDFLEFLKSGSDGAYNRVKFDGTYFRKENDSLNSYELSSGWYIRGVTTSEFGYSLEKINNAYYGGNLEYKIIKDGSSTDYSIEIKSGYAILKRCGSIVYSYGYAQSLYEEDDDADDDNYSSSSSYNNVNIRRGVGKFILALIFPPFVFIYSLVKAQKQEKFNKWLYFPALFLGLIYVGGPLPVLCMDLVRNTDSIGLVILVTIMFVYTGGYLLDIIVLGMNTKIVKLFANKKQLKWTCVTYCLVFVLSIILIILKISLQNF